MRQAGSTPHGPCASLLQKFRKTFTVENLQNDCQPAQQQPTRVSKPVAIEQVALCLHAANPPEDPLPRSSVRDSPLVKMVVVNYLLFESAVGFSLFEVVHQADTVGLELPEVKEAMKALDKFGKMVQLRSFNPWT